MKLLSVSIPHHDVNLAFSGGGDVRYLKLERTRQVKRFRFEELAQWKQEAQALWGREATEADDYAFTLDPGALPPAVRAHVPPEALGRLLLDQSQAEPLPPAVCRYLGVPRGWMVSHHLSHALSTWMLEPRAPDVQVVIDGVGDGRAWSVYRGGRMVGMGPIQDGSIGWGMREMGKLLGVQYGHYNDIAGKVMGLQSFGQVDEGYLRVLARLGIAQLREVWSPTHWLAWKGDPLVGRNTLLDWAATVHLHTGRMLLELFRRFARPSDLVSYSGGVAQNVVWNSVLRREFPGLLVPPHACDEGLSLGSLEWLRIHHRQPPLRMQGFPWAQADTGAPAPSASTIEAAADRLASGQVVGWFQGQGEVGPRALGNRSILADPRLPDGRDRLNRIKRREAYRPFGAAVLAEHFSGHFEGEADGCMLYACRVKGSGLPAVTHVDGSCRVQLVDASNAPFHALLSAFHARTGCPVLANTSLNLAGKPLAAHPDHAVQLFDESPLDALVAGDRLLAR